MLSRDDITAALLSSGAGAKGWIEEMSKAALRSAGVGEFADPRRFGVALGHEFRALVIGTDDVRAFVEGRRISYLWRPDRGECGLNAFLGLALALVAERRAAARDVVLLAARLALPGFERDMACDLEQQVYLPHWFIGAYHRAQRTAPEVRLVVAR